MQVALGLSVPPHTPHAISVSLPTWRDNVGYEEGEKRVVDSMVSGYPRFFIHLSIRKLASLCEQKHAVGNEKAMLFPTRKIAEQSRSFIKRRSASDGTPVNARLLHLFICPESDGSKNTIENDSVRPSADLHVVLFPGDSFHIAKEFWQHTGQGISSRLAERCLSLWPEDSSTVPSRSVCSRFPSKGHNRHYSAVKSSYKPPSPTFNFPPSPILDDLSKDHSVYLEEHYGRNLPLAAAAFTKRALRSRVAGVLKENFSNESCTEEKDLLVGPSTRGVTEVAAHDVYLYPTGMSAIWNAHNVALAVLPPAKSICFGFPYIDTLKVLQKWGPGCHFLGLGLDTDVDQLEILLEEEFNRNPTDPPILALFTEFPSNPLLRSANLHRLRGLADKYDFLIIIDETVGNFVNVEVLPYADIVVSSLTKVFSGASNVMGGSLVLNPQGRHYQALKKYMDENFEDNYFDEDAIFMERNSRDFKQRIRVINSNTETVCDFLQQRSLAGGASSPVIKQVFYPKYITPENYNRHRINSGGYGGLFSLTFTSLAASVAFYDALPCYKGPSLGTNFTLACPFTILAHFTELDWAAQFGVEEGLVRITVGMEDADVLLRSFGAALAAAEAVNSENVSRPEAHI